MAKTSSLPTDFDDEVLDQTEESTANVDPPAVGKDEEGIPYCVKHHCRMKQVSGGKKGSAIAYFACPVDGCTEKAKRIKTTKSIVPAEPHLCPRCTSVSPRPIMERDQKLSNGFYTILKCPCCGHKSAPMPRPEFVASHERSRGVMTAEDLGAR
jgi:hypothetical protein